MILDGVFHGVINEDVGTLEVYDEPVEDVSLTTFRARIVLMSSAAHIHDGVGYVEADGRCGEESL